MRVLLSLLGRVQRLRALLLVAKKLVRSWGDGGFVQEKKEAEEEQHEQQDTLTAAPDLPLAESLDRRDDEEDVLNLDSEPGKEQQLDVQEAPGTAGSWYGIRNLRSDTPTSLEANGEDQKSAKSDAAWGKNFFFSGRKAEGHVSLEKNNWKRRFWSTRDVQKLKLLHSRICKRRKQGWLRRSLSIEKALRDSEKGRRLSSTESKKKMWRSWS
jgi:hypothetical protein